MLEVALEDRPAPDITQFRTLIGESWEVDCHWPARIRPHNAPRMSWTPKSRYWHGFSRFTAMTRGWATLNSSARASQERQKQIGEPLRAFDLRHVPDTGQQVHLRMRVHPTRLVDVVCGQHSVARAPHDQRRSRIAGHRGGQFPPPPAA